MWMRAQGMRSAYAFLNDLVYDNATMPIHDELIRALTEPNENNEIPLLRITRTKAIARAPLVFF
jgi:hypothetical protein